MATGDQTDMLARIKRLLPPWFGQDAGPTPILDALLQAPAWALSFLYVLYAYAKAQTRISTATDGWLDLISADFFGDQLPRNTNESDASFLMRIKANLFPASNTLAAIAAAVTAITGIAPRIVSPWKSSDTGIWDGPAGAGMMFWDVDNATTPFRWTDGHRGEIFLEIPISPLAVLGNAAMPAFDAWPSWDTYSFAFIDLGALAIYGAQRVITALQRLSVCGVEVFAEFLGLAGEGGAAHWDKADETYDSSDPQKWDAL